MIVGDGPYRDELATALADKATFTGFLADTELARTVASCDLFLFSSTTDTLGRAVIEAQACGVPAIVRDAGGARECVAPGVSGIVAPAGDDRACWAAVETLLDDEPARRAMSEAARRFAASRTWADVLEEFVLLVGEVAGRDGGPHAVVSGTTELALTA